MRHSGTILRRNLKVLFPAAVPALLATVLLTVLSPTMVYAEVFNMISYAPDYVGKTIRMQGPAVSYTDEEIGKTYYACLIQDATACCATGLEYVLPEGSEYPEDGEEITVTGTFDTYVDVDKIEYCRLISAVLETDAGGKTGEEHT